MGNSSRTDHFCDRTLTRRDLLAGAAGLAGLAAFGAAPREAEAASASISYRVHVQRIGWSQGWKSNGATAGTSGRSLRLEAIQIKLAGKPVSGSIQYRTHVQKQGWQGWRSDGATSGTSGKSLRLEAIQIRLTGQMAERYDVWYRVHAQKFGWMGWARNGASAGSAGYSYRLEAIQVKLVAKGSAAPGSTSRPFAQKSAKDKAVDAIQGWWRKRGTGPSGNPRNIMHVSGRTVTIYDDNGKKVRTVSLRDSNISQITIYGESGWYFYDLSLFHPDSRKGNLDCVSSSGSSYSGTDSYGKLSARPSYIR